MKRIILFFILVSVLSIPQVSLAYMGLGSQYDPIHVQIEQSPLDKLRAEQQSVQLLRNSLKSQYGTTAYYSCYDSSPCTKNDLSFPGASKLCEYQIQSCLGNKKTSSKCQSGYGFNGTTCVPFDQGCKERWGSTSYWDTNTQKCIIPSTPIKTNDQICTESYLNSKWEGKLNDKGGLVCGCKTGYQWNTSNSQCVSIPPAIVNQDVALQKPPVKPKAKPLPVKVKIIEQKQIVSTAPVPEPTAEVTPKKVGLFQKLFGLFK